MFETNPTTYAQAKLAEVAHLRQAKNDILDELNKLQAIINATPEGQAVANLVATLRTLNERLTMAEQETRNAVLGAFQETGERKPVPGAEVKMFATVNITDERAAMTWAIQHVPAAVSLDTKKFGAAVKNLELPFIEVGEEPRGQIASDLSEYLK